MSVTISTLTPAQFREELQELLQLATQYAALESRIEEKAMQLERSDWEMGLNSQFINAVSAEVRGALEGAKREHGHSDFDALQLCQDIQDALDVISFAMERRDDAR